MKKIIFFFFFLFPFTFLSAQSSSYSIKGKVVSQEGEPVVYASVTITDKEGRIKTFCITGEEGDFILRQPDAGIYFFNISCVGYLTVKEEIKIDGQEKNMGDIILKGIELDEVKIQRKKQHFKVLPDRIIYDVESDSSAQDLKTMEVLEKLPFVEIDTKDNKLKVLGEKDFVITVNGKKNLFLSEANQYVARMQEAGELKQIELITTPEGKYSDKTAVINIVTKGRLQDGYVANIFAYANTIGVSVDLDITAKFNDFIFKLYMEDYFMDNPRLKGDSEIINYEQNENYKTITEEESWNKHVSRHIQWDASYDISEKDLVTLIGYYQFTKNRDRLKSLTEVFNKQNTITDYYRIENKDKTINDNWLANINYQRTFEKKERLFTTTYNLNRSGKDKTYRQTNFALDEENGLNSTSFNDLSTVEHTIGADFYDPINENHSYFLTGKWTHRDYSSVYKDMEDENLDYTQSIPSFRGNYSYKDSKSALTLEVTLEKTTNKLNFKDNKLTKNYFYFIPRINYRYKITTKSTVSFSYNIPSYRPSITYLNPYVDKSNPSHFNMGNPNLKPERSQRASLDYAFAANDLSISLNTVFEYSGNSIESYDFVNEDGILVSTYGNIGKKNTVTFRPYMNWEVADVFSIYLNLSAKYAYYSYDGSNYRVWSYTGNMYSMVDITKKIYVLAGGYIGSNSSSIQNTKNKYRINYYLRTGYNISPRLTLRIDCETFLHRRINSSEERKSDEFYYHRNQQLDGRTIDFAIDFTFGNLKKGVKGSRRSISNDDTSR